jgi:hypothetical protein
MRRPGFVYTRQLGSQCDTWQLRAASYDGSAWQFALVDSGPWFRNAIYSSLAPSYGVNNIGLGVVAYARVSSDSTYEVRVAEQVGDTWVKEVIGSRTEHGAWFYVPTPVLAVGPVGRVSVWLGVPDEGPTDTGLLLLASKVAGTWRWDTVGRLWMSGYAPYAAEIDSDGRDHLVYTADWGLYYRVGQPGSWTVELVRGPFGRGEEAADLAFVGGVPHIVASSTMDPLYNSYRTPPGWTHETIPSLGGIGPSFSQDPAGTLYVCFVEDLRYLRLARRTVAPGIIEESHGPSCGCQLTISPSVAGRRATVRYSLPGESQVALCVYNAAGKYIAAVFRGRQSRGLHAATWDAGSASLAALPAGTYFLRLDAGRCSAITKLVKTE